MEKALLVAVGVGIILYYESKLEGPPPPPDDPQQGFEPLGPPDKEKPIGPPVLSGPFKTLLPTASTTPFKPLQPPKPPVTGGPVLTDPFKPLQPPKPPATHQPPPPPPPAKPGYCMTSMLSDDWQPKDGTHLLEWPITTPPYVSDRSQCVMPKNTIGFFGQYANGTWTGEFVDPNNQCPYAVQKVGMHVDNQPILMPFCITDYLPNP